MYLRSLSYIQFPETNREWKLKSLELDPHLNLIVGKNSTGKTWTLNLIQGLSKIVSNRQKPSLQSGEWEATFQDGDDEYYYELRIVDGNVAKEVFRKGNQVLLNRGPTGEGEIYATKQGQLIEFQTPTTDLAAVFKRDSKQHGFFEKLHEWGMSLFSYKFGSDLGKSSYGFQSNKFIDVDVYNQDHVIAIFAAGKRNIGDDFVRAVKQDMARIGYKLDNIEAATPTGLVGIPANMVGLSVREHDLECFTEQHEISQGMFRALSVLIQFNYAQMSSKAGCVVVDDIGEGLDFSRSRDLIALLKEKAKTTNVQLILSTNDRFIMNEVPLTSWTVLRRTGSLVKALNYSNSKEIFDEFKFTGLSNFDFFSMDFADGGFKEPENAK